MDLILLAMDQQILTSLIQSPVTLKIFAVTLVSLIVLILIGRFYHRTTLAKTRTQSSRIRKPWEIIKDDGGAAMIEFTLVLPVFLFFVLLLGQTMLIMIGNIYTHYAAYAAARAAIVQIPMDDSDSGETTNIIEIDGDEYAPTDNKFSRIFEAAIYALAPVSGRSDSNPGVASTEYQADIQEFFSNYGETPPHWSERLPSKQLQYAANNTYLRLYKVTGAGLEGVNYQLMEGTVQYNPHEPITVRVMHQFGIAVPYVGFIYADGENGDDYLYTELTAEYTLINEGISPELPPMPSVPRLD